jgi:hypothetical protein
VIFDPDAVGGGIGILISGLESSGSEEEIAARDAVEVSPQVLGKAGKIVALKLVVESGWVPRRECEEVVSATTGGRRVNNYCMSLDRKKVRSRDLCF